MLSRMLLRRMLPRHVGCRLWGSTPKQVGPIQVCFLKNSSQRCKSTQTCFDLPSLPASDESDLKVEVASISKEGSDDSVVCSFKASSSSLVCSGDSYLVLGLVAGIHSNLKQSFIDSKPPQNILDNLNITVEGVLSRLENHINDTGVVVEPRTLKVHHILLESNEKALDVLNMTKVGTESFASLARRHSRCGSGLSTGGSLGEIQRGQLDADFEDAAFKANPNSIIGPITTAHGHHLILTERTNDDTESDLTQKLKLCLRVKVKVPSPKFNGMVHACILQATNSSTLTNKILGFAGNTGRSIEGLFDEVVVSVLTPSGIWRLDVGPPPSQF